MSDRNNSQMKPGNLGQMKVNSPSAAIDGQSNSDQAERQRRQREAEMEQRRLLLNQVMAPEAREKLANIRLVKPDRADRVESMIISALQSGQLTGRINEEQVKSLLETVVEQTRKETKVTIVRRRRAFEEDDDDDLDDDNW